MIRLVTVFDVSSTWVSMHLKRRSRDLTLSLRIERRRVSRGWYMQQVTILDRVCVSTLIGVTTETAHASHHYQVQERQDGSSSVHFTLGKEKGGERGTRTSFPLYPSFYDHPFNLLTIKGPKLSDIDMSQLHLLTDTSLLHSADYIL
jgi:hypothetical protein